MEQYGYLCQVLLLKKSNDKGVFNFNRYFRECYTTFPIPFLMLKSASRIDRF